MSRSVKLWGNVCLAASLAIPAFGQFTGAIQTSDSTGTIVNANIYQNKADVYLNGGPQNKNSAGLPDGNYYFQVTDPSGATLLSTDPAQCRQVHVSGGVITGWLVVGGCNPHLNGTNNNITGTTPVQLIPYDDTPNNGDEYKLTVFSEACSTVISDLVPNSGDQRVITVTDNGSCTKSDNFKVKVKTPPCTQDCGPQLPPQSLVGGVKFYDNGPADANALDGILNDPSEGPLQGWSINVTFTSGGVGPQTTTIVTDQSGSWSVTADQGTGLTACEVLQNDWVQTGPKTGFTLPGFTVSQNGSGVNCWTGTVPAQSVVSGLNFGNVAKIYGNKYYDGNADGVPGNGLDTTLNGFKVVACFDAGCSGVQVTQSTFTSGLGAYSFYLPSPTSTYTVCEIKPNNTWFQTGPLFGASLFPANTGAGTANSTQTTKCWSGSGPTNGLFLTNVCFASTGGHTIGFWSNKNGQALENDADFTLLTGLNLRKGDGSNQDFPNPPNTTAQNKTALNAFLLGATATNMANMLSAQLTAMELNVSHNFLSGTSIIYAPGTTAGGVSGFATINAVMAEANTLLGQKGLILAGDPDRARAEALKTALDNANNNLNIVSGTPCPFTSPY